MNPIFGYEIMKSIKDHQAICPRCGHRNMILKPAPGTKLVCKKCGKKFKK